MAKKLKANGKALREEWLQKAITKYIVAWAKLGVAIPDDVRVSCSFPGGGAPNKRIGECWPRARSAAKVNELFINPILAQPLAVLDVLGHELLHAADDCKSKHGKPFTALSKRVGYSGGKHSAAETDEAKRFQTWLAGELGPYPHAEVYLGKKDATKENKGVHKFMCAVGTNPDESDEGSDDESGFKPDVLYSTAKMVELHGVPKCRCHGEDMVPVERQKQKITQTI